MKTTLKKNTRANKTNKTLRKKDSKKVKKHKTFF